MQSYVFDRTQNDLLNKTEKAYLNSQDLDRIEDNIQYISAQLNLYGYTNKPAPCKNWSIFDFFKMADLQRIVDTINSFLDAYHTPPESSALHCTRYIDYRYINEIEKLLYDLDAMIQNMTDSFAYAGTYAAGEDVI